MSYTRKAIQDMKGYSYGEQPKSEAALKLNTNENPYPPSPAVAEALKTFKVDSLRLYPEANCTEFRMLAAKVHGLKPDQVMATNGGDELLRLAVTTFVPQGGALGSTEPTYSLYPVLAAIQEARFIGACLAEGGALAKDFAEQMNEAAVQLAFLVNPHAPSGYLTETAELKRIADKLDGILLIDEAYVDFVSPERHYNSLSLLESCPNVLILRTLSKGYALAGLRFGYALGASSLIAPMMEKTRDSYNLDSIAQTLSCAAFRDQAYTSALCLKIRLERSKMTQALRKRGWHVNASEANFILAKPPGLTASSAQYYFKALRKQNIFVRYFKGSLANALRISIGTDTQNKRFLAAIDQIAANSQI